MKLNRWGKERGDLEDGSIGPDDAGVCGNGWKMDGWIIEKKGRE